MTAIVIAGAGLAGVGVAEALRGLGHDGEIVIIGSETHLPYDRPPLSKEVLRGTKGMDDIRLRPSFDDLAVDLRLGREVTAVDQTERTVRTNDGETCRYDHLVVATGLRPRRLAGTEGRSRVHALRTWDDSAGIAAQLADARRVLVVGAGFIGCEIAASMRESGLEVVLVEPNATPLEPAVGPLVGGFVARLHRDRGVDLRTGVGVQRLDADHAGVRARLDDTSVVDADLAVVGIGAVPCTGWLADTDLDLRDGVLCGSDGRTADPAIWAVGDVACRTPCGGGTPRRVEHWTAARTDAKTVARGILGLAAAPEAPEYVWSDQYGAKLQVVGRVTVASIPHVLAEGDDKFLVAFVEDGRLAAVAGMGMARRVMALRRSIGCAVDHVVVG